VNTTKEQEEFLMSLAFGLGGLEHFDGSNGSLKGTVLRFSHDRLDDLLRILRYHFEDIEF